MPAALFVEMLIRMFPRIFSDLSRGEAHNGFVRAVLMCWVRHCCLLNTFQASQLYQAVVFLGALGLLIDLEQMQQCHMLVDARMLSSCHTNSLA